MARHLRIVLGVALPALAVCLSASARGPSEEDEESRQLRKAAAAREDVLRLADSLDRDEDEIERQAQAIADKHDLGSVMWVFKLRDKGGVGVGNMPDTVRFDGIELELLALDRKPPTPKELQDHRDDFIRMAKVSLAVARATPLYASRYTGERTGRDRRTWVQLSKDMRDGSQDLIDALKRDDLKAVKKAVNDLNWSCNGCHCCIDEP